MSDKDIKNRRKEIELVKYENTLFDIKSNLDKKEQQLAEKERELEVEKQVYKKKIVDEFLAKIKNA